MKQFSSKLIEKAVSEIAKMPGIGKKSALRMVLFILKEDLQYAQNIAEAIINLRSKTQYCNKCHNIADSTICSICSNLNRQSSVICVVENIQDVLAIENTAQFRGLYHVLGGAISPMNGITPDKLNIDSLIERVKSNDFKEIIFALSTTIEGDTTTFYITKKLKELNISTSTISRGISVGGELEYTDEITLGRSILNRIPYDI